VGILAASLLPLQDVSASTNRIASKISVILFMWGNSLVVESGL
jgi:hypothetical protein